jgi:hypothetical protein
MSEPRIEILGAYKIELTDEMLEYFAGGYLDDSIKQEMLNREHEEYVVAFDVRVENADSSFDAGDFTQPESDEVTYWEVYLSPDGHSIEATWGSKPLDLTNFRMYFFLHHIDLRKPLLTDYGALKIPTLKPLPDYLKCLHPYTTP